MTTNSPTNTNQASEEHLDNDKEELKRNIMQVVDGFRFDQEWVSHQADDFPDHKGAGCGCGVCQKMKGINESTADSVLTFVDEYTQSKLKAFAGEVEEAIGEDLPPCWAHDSRDDGEDYQGVDSVEIAGHKHYPCSTNEEAEQFNLRLTEQRQALKAIKEKAGIE